MLLSWAFARFNTTELNILKHINTLQKQFFDKESELSQTIELMVREKNVSALFPEILDTYVKSSKTNNDFAFYLFRDSALIFWSNSSIPVQNYEQDLMMGNKKLLLLPNGYYYCRTAQIENIVISGLIPVYYMYSYQNDALKNGFAKHWDMKCPVRFSTDFSEQNAIKNSDNQFLFSLTTQPDARANTIPFVIIYLFLLAAIGVFLLMIFKILQRFVSRKYVQLPLFIVIAVALRLLQIKFGVPGYIYSDTFFSPLHYAWNVWFASLGDLITNIFVVFFSGVIIWHHHEQSIRFYRKKIKRILLLIFFPLFSFGIYFFVMYLLNSLIINSTLILSFDDILKLKSTDFAGFLIIVLMLPTFLYITFILFQNVRKNLRQRGDKIICFAFVLLCSILLILIKPVFAIPVGLFPLYFAVSVSLRKKLFRISGGFGIISIVFITLGFGMVMNSTNREKEENLRKLYAIQLSNEQDPIGEFLFEEVAANIKSDSVFFSEVMKSSDPQQFAAEYLKRKYLSGYFSKYEIQVTICKPEDILLIMPSNTEFPCQPFFETLKMQYGTPTFVENYWLVDDETGRPNYLYEMRCFNNETSLNDTLLLYLELITIPGISVLGYPELLVEEKVMRKSGRYDYTYAKYFNKELINQSGDYTYPLYLDNEISDSDIYFFHSNNYSHLIYPVNQKTTLIVSLPEKMFFERAATFSYLLILFTIAHYIFLLIISVISRRKVFALFTFKTRLQTASVFLVILSFIVAGIITVNFFIRYHNNKNKEIIKEKSYSLLVELEHKLRNYDILTNEDSNYLNDLMVKFSNVFFTDINLFSTSGRLIATSRAQVYQQGLTSTYMNPDALKTMKESYLPYLLQSESIGSLNYISSYLPFRNYRNDVIAYLNLPYFARENELRKEISSFLIAFINFYVVLIVFAIIIALIIASYITLPLKIVGEKLRMLKPGQPNEKIKWNKHDDIGILVEEYNRMVDMLAASTKQLMKTERESAWREMAKQIAHEIKNPLTPMKLSLQNLERAWNDKASDYEERMKRTSQTLIEQIDALAKIATDFANFAKMQEAKLYPVNVIPFIVDSIHLYQNEWISIQLYYEDSQSYMVFADDTQMIQILNNLIKNAVQSVPQNDMGEIEIRVVKSNALIEIRIQDNGSGISDDIKDKIFSPNFTSKSGGTGLGLAITKKITDHLGGSIAFESEKNKGSTFIVRLPEYSEISE